MTLGSADPTISYSDYAMPNRPGPRNILSRRHPLKARPLLSIVCFAALTAALFGGEVTTERIQNADQEPHNWLSYGRDYRSWRYSPLEEINREQRQKARPRLGL